VVTDGVGRLPTIIALRIAPAYWTLAQRSSQLVLVNLHRVQDQSEAAPPSRAEGRETPTIQGENVTDIERLGTNGQTIRFLLAAQGARRPIFVTGNAKDIVPGIGIPAAAPLASIPSASPVAATRQSQIYAGQGAFDMPQLIGALAATLAATPDREIN